MRDEVRTRLSRAAKLAAVLAALSVAVSGCGVFDVLRLGWPSGVTPQASAMRDLWIWSIVAALIVGVIVWGLMLWTIIFHRRKADDDDLPRQFQYNLPLEIIYTVIPLVIVTALFAVTVLVQNYVDTDRPDPDVRVDVTAFQWNWAFEYPDKTDFTGRPVTTLGTSNEIPIMVLPTDRRIEFTLVSRDVIHSFWVIDFLFKRDVFPRPEKNDTDNVWQVDKIEREGAFVGRCAELCGAYHCVHELRGPRAASGPVRPLHRVAPDRQPGDRDAVHHRRRARGPELWSVVRPAGDHHVAGGHRPNRGQRRGVRAAMKVEARVFEILCAFFFVAGIVYALVGGESVGIAGLFLCGGLALIIGTYFRFVSRRLEPRPEDNPEAEVSDGAGELGFFSPGSYWPIALATSAALLGVGIAYWQISADHGRGRAAAHHGRWAAVRVPRPAQRPLGPPHPVVRARRRPGSVRRVPRRGRP